MRLRFFALPYKVKNPIEGWHGWRLKVRYFGIGEKCDCPELEHEPDHTDQPCKCASRGPHGHSGFGYIDSPIGFPGSSAGGE